MRPSFAGLVISVLVLGVFYPSLFGEALSIDDKQMMLGMINAQGGELWRFFVPHGGLYYYRPLLGLSFYAEHLLFDNQAAISHCINIFLHLANTLLLYGLLRRFFRLRDYEWPLLAALFFGLHPLVTEPVDWISGRTDLLAGFFVLLAATLFLLNTSKNMGRDWLAALCYLCGLWSKEVAIGLLPVVVFVVQQQEGFALRGHGRVVCRRFFPFAVMTVLYAVLRTGGHLAGDIGIRTAVLGGHGAEYFTVMSKLLSLVKAVGFYAQKILWPFPLNFAIADINQPVALVVGMVAIVGVLAVLVMLRNKKFMWAWVWIPCFLAPALPVAVNRVAWTLFAERYLYLPLMGLSALVVVLLAHIPWKNVGVLLMGCLLAGFGTATAQRNIVWQSNLTLWQDVVTKSPGFAPAYNDYAVALQRAGRRQEAQAALARASVLVGDRGRGLVTMNNALQAPAPEQQVAQLEQVLAQEHDSALRGKELQTIIRIVNRTLLTKKEDPPLQAAWTRKLLGWHQQLAKLDNDPFHWYRIGQLHLFLGDKKAAQVNFAKACETSNDYYTQAACTLAKRLADKPAGHK